LTHWLVDKLGLTRDASRGETARFKPPGTMMHMDALMEQAGLGPTYWDSQYADTMDSHRLAWYAATESREKAELMWRALSRRFFEGKDTDIRPIRLDCHKLLMECAKVAGLDLDRARRVLESDMYRKEIRDTVRQMHLAGINSIPVLIFEVEGTAEGSWLHNPDCIGRRVHHGSGNAGEFCAILQKLHADSESTHL